MGSLDKTKVESAIVYCQYKENYVQLFKTKGTAINFKCYLCDHYAADGRHRFVTEEK